LALTRDRIKAGSSGFPKYRRQKSRMAPEENLWTGVW
jgi:hypothetical protein